MPVPAPARPAPSAGSRTQSPAGRDDSDRPASAPTDDDRLDELTGLLGGPSPAVSPTPYPRPGRRPDDVRRERAADPFAARETPSAFAPEPEPVRPAVVRTPAVRPAWSSFVTDEPADEPAAAPQPLGSAATPSPFTAALARMVSGDSEVRQAVEEALAEPAEVRAPAAAGPWPTWSGPARATETSVWSRATHLEEEPVELQDYTPSSAPALVEPPAAVPTWVAAPEEAPQPSSSDREQAIAEVLRAALAQDRSDEALAGILRKVMDGASPQAALAESVRTQAVEAAPVAEAARVVESPVVDESVVEEPVAEVAPVTEPAVEAPVAEAEPVIEEQLVETRSALFGGSDLGWDDDHSSSLWADTVTPAAPAAPAEAVTEAVTDEPLPAVPVEEQIEIVAEQAAEAFDDETELAEQAEQAEELSPVLARTASDPAPMSLDATTVMPPLSLLPPLPSSRQRGGRPPVPPAASRAAAPVRTTKALADQASAPAPADLAEALATVTRLPLAPTEETPAPVVEAALPVVERQPVDTPAPAAPAAAAPAGDAAQDTAVIAPVVADATPDSANRAPGVRAAEVRAAVRAAARAAVATPPARTEVRPVRAPRPVAPARPRVAVPAAAVPADADVTSRLTALGLPAELLGDCFAAEATAHGTYAALTRALAARLPEVPELPDRRR